MAVNRNKVDLWKTDVAKSVDFYNDWFMKFAPKAFRDTRIETTKQVEQALQWTENLTNIRPETLQSHPSVLPMLRMTTCPPIARDPSRWPSRCVTKLGKEHGNRKTVFRQR